MKGTLFQLGKDSANSDRDENRDAQERPQTGRPSKTKGKGDKGPDTGDRVDYIKAIVQLAVERDDLGPELRPWLKQFAADLD